MSWYGDKVAHSMGYRYGVLFDCARDALKAWPHNIVLPGNICRSVFLARPDAMLREVSQVTGLAEDAPVHLYGYQSPAAEGFKLTLDPLMTVWVRHLKTESAIISFGRKKILSLGYGGAFLTQNRALAAEMDAKGHWNHHYTEPLIKSLDHLTEHIEHRWEAIRLWDRYLGDSLTRIPQEQLMPWRAMRQADSLVERNSIVYELREAGIDVGTNYPPLTGRNRWGDIVLNFFCSTEKDEIEKASEIIKRIVCDRD